jgi:hypothetical protein
MSQTVGRFYIFYDRKRRNKVKKEKTPHTLTSGDEVCRAIFAHFFHFFVFLREEYKKNQPSTLVPNGQLFNARIASQK